MFQCRNLIPAFPKRKKTNMVKQQVDGREGDRDTQGAREGVRVHTEMSTNGPLGKVAPSTAVDQVHTEISITEPLRKSWAIQHSRPGAPRIFD